MTKAEDWTGVSEDAQLYEQKFVPNLFGPWAPVVATAAEIHAGDRVLDIGCGTGVLAREAARRAGSTGQVTGLDLDDGMLSMARLSVPAIDWRQGDACDLPFDDESFDVVVSQFALMYFPDQRVALWEMARVLTKSGRLALAVWAPFEFARGYVRLAEVAERHASKEAEQILRRPHRLGDPDMLRPLFEQTDFENLALEITKGFYSQPSIDAFLEAEVQGSPLHKLFDDDSYAAFLEEAREALQPFCNQKGELVIPMDATIVTARKRG